jgi:hypothetical protein
LLGGESFLARRRNPSIAKDLDRRGAIEIVSMGEIDHPHSAFAHNPNQAIGTESTRSPIGQVALILEDLLGGLGDIAVEQV